MQAQMQPSRPCSRSWPKRDGVRGGLLKYVLEASWIIGCAGYTIKIDVACGIDGGSKLLTVPQLDRYSSSIASPLCRSTG
jgi:hypothetical protein